MTWSFVTTLVEKCVNDLAHQNFQKFPLGYSFWLDNIFHFSELPGWCMPKIIYFYCDKFGARVINVIFPKPGMNDSNIEWDWQFTYCLVDLSKVSSQPLSGFNWQACSREIQQPMSPFIVLLEQYIPVPLSFLLLLLALLLLYGGWQMKTLMSLFAVLSFFASWQLFSSHLYVIQYWAEVSYQSLNSLKFNAAVLYDIFILSILFTWPSVSCFTSASVNLFWIKFSCLFLLFPAILFRNFILLVLPSFLFVMFQVLALKDKSNLNYTVKLF